MPSQLQNQQIKIIILGLAESGKSTLIQSTLEGIQPSKDDKYNATINYQRIHKKFYNIDLTILDLGGQTRFLDKFTGDLSEFVFSGLDAGAFIFVLDALKVNELSRAKFYYDLSLRKIKEYSPNSKIYIFLNKMDLIPLEFKVEITRVVQGYLTSDSIPINKIYETSVFSESIFQAIGDVLSEVSGINKKLLPLIQDFIKNNPKIISQIILMTTEGAFLLIEDNDSNIQKLSVKNIREAFISSIHNLSLQEVVFDNIIVEDQKNELLSVLSLLNNGLSLMIIFCKKAIRENPSYSSTIYDLILSLSNRIIN